VSAHNVLQIDTSVEILVRFDVAIIVSLLYRCAVVFFWEKTRSPQDKASKAVITVEEFTKILSRGLRHAIDVLGNRCDVLGDPCGGRSGRKRQSRTEGTGRLVKTKE